MIEISEREIKELRMTKQLKDIERQKDEAWHRFYNSDAYQKHPDHLEYNRLQKLKWELEAELKKVQEE